MTTVTQSCSNNSYYAGIALKTTAAAAGIVFAVSSVALSVLLAAPVLPAIIVGVVTLVGFSLQSATIIAIFSATLMAIALGATHQLQAPPAKKADDAPVPLTRSPEAEESSSEASSLASSRSSTPGNEVKDLAQRAAEIAVPAEEEVEEEVEEENKLGNESDSLSAASTDSTVVSFSGSPPPLEAAAAAAAAVEVQAEKTEEEAASTSANLASPHTSRPATPKAEERKLFDSETGFWLYTPPTDTYFKENHPKTPKAEERKLVDSETALPLFGPSDAAAVVEEKPSSQPSSRSNTPSPEQGSLSSSSSSDSVVVLDDKSNDRGQEGFGFLAALG